MPCIIAIISWNSTDRQQADKGWGGREKVIIDFVRLQFHTEILRVKNSSRFSGIGSKAFARTNSRGADAHSVTSLFLAFCDYNRV